MEGAAIVEARGAEGEEVLGGLGHGFAEELELEVTVGGVELGGLVDVYMYVYMYVYVYMYMYMYICVCVVKGGRRTVTDMLLGQRVAAHCSRVGCGLAVGWLWVGCWAHTSGLGRRPAGWSCHKRELDSGVVGSPAYTLRRRPCRAHAHAPGVCCLRLPASCG